jgi:two-component system, cell cycle sensor histidine kinase and response regulator CckA
MRPSGAVDENTERTRTVRVVIADDSALLRRRVRRELEDDPTIAVVGEAADAPSAVALVERLRPDTLLLDLRMPGGGFSVLEAAKRLEPAPAVVVLTNYGFDEYRDRAATLGADEFLDKSRQIGEIAGAVRRAGGVAAEVARAGAGGAELQALLDGLEDAVVLLDDDDRIVAVNTAWGAASVRNDLGGAYGEATVARFEDGRAQVAAIIAALREVREGRRPSFTLTFSLMREGQSVWLRVSGRRMDGDPRRRILVTHANVTEVEALAQALRESEQRFRRLADNAQDIVYRYRLAPTRGFEYVSPASTAMTGFTPEDHYADPDLGWKLVHPDDRHLVEEAAGASGQGPVTLRWIRKDGTEIWTEQRNTVIRDEHGTPVAVEGIARDVTARMTRQQATEASEQQLRALFDLAPDAYVLLTPAGAILRLNHAAEHLFGYPERAVAGRLVRELDVLPGVEIERARHLETRVDSASTAESAEFDIRRADGSAARVEARVNRVVLDGQETLLVMARDVTERRRTEAQVLRLSTALEAAVNAVVIARPDGAIEWVNSAFTRLTGYALDEVRGHNPRLLKSGVHGPAFYEDLWGSIGRGEPWTGRLVNRRKDGSLYTEEMTITPVRGADGRISHFIAIKEDVTAREAAAAAVRASEARLRAAFEHTAVGIIHAGPDGRLLRVNPRLGEMLGYAPEALVGRDFREITHPEDLAANLASYESVLTGERDEYHLEKRYLHRHGHAVWAHVTTAAVRDDAGQVEYFISVAEDITQRRALEQQLYQVQKIEAVGRLAGGVAHDFNNLLTIIRGETELALADAAAGGAVTESLLSIARAADRATTLTGRLLAFSRKQVIEPSTIPIRTFLEDTQRMLHRLVEERIAVRLEVAGDVGVVSADRDQLEQVLLNLVVNARDAITGEGTITVGARDVELTEEFAATHPGARAGRYVMITVTDTGCGMSEEVRAHAFEPFYTTKPRGKGTGLGLATCFGIVKQSGGYIWIDTDVGVGTEVRVYLPAVEAVADPPERETIVPAGPEGEVVLLVEDEDAVRRLARRVLEAGGYGVFEAADGHAALRVLEEHPVTIHLLLTDVVMPGLGGRETAARALERCPDLRVLFMSGYLDDELLRGLVEGDAAALLRKPFSREQLLHAVRDALDTAPVRG